MKIFIIITTVLINVHANPQSETGFQFSPVSPNIPPIVSETSTSSNESMILEPVKEPQDEFVQCLYDFKGNRINKGCVITERPPTCDKGLLVQTIIGDDFEMCCCNFSNIS